MSNKRFDCFWCGEVITDGNANHRCEGEFQWGDFMESGAYEIELLSSPAHQDSPDAHELAQAAQWVRSAKYTVGRLVGELNLARNRILALEGKPNLPRAKEIYRTALEYALRTRRYQRQLEKEMLPSRPGYGPGFDVLCEIRRLVDGYAKKLDTYLLAPRLPDPAEIQEAQVAIESLKNHTLEQLELLREREYGYG